MGYAIFQRDALDFQDRGDGSNRSLARLSDSMTQMRANVWRYGPGTRGRRHAERVQEETFVVLEGTPTMLLGDPPQRVELSPGSIVVVSPGTALQVRNESGAEAVVVIVGAPPQTGQADYLPDID